MVGMSDVDSYVSWLLILSVATLLLVAFTAWVEADEGRMAVVDRIWRRVFGEGPR